MGEVYASQDPAGRPVAVKNVRKTISMDRAMVERLANEARLLERVVHHNVVRAVDRGTDPDGAPYLVMSYVDGDTLWQLIEREGPLSVERAFAITTQILTGLAAIHEARVVHADIKSNNVLVDDQDRVTIIDFGLARTLSRELPRENMLAGTPAFMAPEIVSGSPPTITADIYAVGIILYEMLTGMTPFAHSSDIFDSHLHEPVVAPSLRAPHQNIPFEIDRLVLRALDKDPTNRFPTARDFAASLDAARSTQWRNATVDMSAARATPTRDLGIRSAHQFLRDGREPSSSTTAAASRTPVAAPSIENAPTSTSRVRDIISIALERAGTLVDSHNIYGAIAELESGLASLMRLANNMTLDQEAWRLESVLAALYGNLGRRSHARRMAALASSHARLSGNPVAIERTRSLVERLEARPVPSSRMARGSVAPRNIDVDAKERQALLRALPRK